MFLKSSQAIEGSNMNDEKRRDRIFPLKDAAAYSGTDFLDMVFYVPPSEDNKRLWMLTEADSPELMTSTSIPRSADPPSASRVRRA